jgi:ribose-phosphate pyrophosphokinase
VANDAKAEALTIIGEIKDRDVILVDDEVSTGGSMAQAVEILKANGARNIYMVFVHAALTGAGAKKLAGLPVEKFITTNTIPIPPGMLAQFGERLVVLTVADLLGEVICRANQGRSVGEMFGE